MIDFSKLPQKAPEYDLAKLLEAGCHFGHEKRKWNPKIKPYLYMEKDGIHIFDLAKTAQQLQKAYNYAYQLGKQGKTLIFVGTKRRLRDIVQEEAEKAGAMYITQRWLGGFLTNWDQIKKSIKKMNDLEKGLEGEKFDNYTKFEQVQMKKELQRQQRFFRGVRDLKTKPDALFIVDIHKENIAVQEANQSDVPTIAIVDSNADPADVTVAIPANDDAVSSVTYIVKQISEAYKLGQQKK